MVSAVLPACYTLGLTGSLDVVPLKHRPASILRRRHTPLETMNRRSIAPLQPLSRRNIDLLNHRLSEALLTWTQ